MESQVLFPDLSAFDLTVDTNLSPMAKNEREPPTKFQFECSTNEDRPAKPKTSFATMEWKDKNHRRYCGFNFGCADFDFCDSPQLIASFNNKVSISFLRLDASKKLYTFARSKDLKNQNPATDYYSAAGFDRGACPLFAYAGHFSGVVVDDFTHEKQILSLKEKSVDGLSLTNGYLSTFSNSQGLKLFDLRDPTEAVFSSAGQSLFSTPSVFRRLGQNEHWLSLDCSKASLLFDLRQSSQPIYAASHISALTFLAEKPIVVNEIEKSAEILFSGEKVQLNETLLDASFSQRTNKLLLLTQTKENETKFTVYDQRLAVVNELNVGQTKLVRAALLQDRFILAQNKDTLAFFDLESLGNPSPFEEF